MHGAALPKDEEEEEVAAAVWTTDTVLGQLKPLAAAGFDMLGWELEAGRAVGVSLAALDLAAAGLAGPVLDFLACCRCLASVSRLSS